MLLRFRFVFSYLWVLLCGFSMAAQEPSNIQISVITCGPGTDLYATFGHSAFRVQDITNSLDVVYNYGTFNFNTPNFYLKFARGKLLYSLSRERFEDFLYTYQLENRWVKEQILRLTDAQKIELLRFLETNYLPENRDYSYDFLFNNCSTKIPEVLGKVLGDSLKYGDDHLPTRYTFRQLIQQYLNTNSWSSLGIDLALGAVIDRKASAYEHTFLPDYVFLQLDNAKLGEVPLVQRDRDILDSNAQDAGSYFTMSPAFWLFLGLLFTVAITFIDFKNGSRSRALDFIIFSLTGIAGLLLVFLWFFTDHTATAWNYNLLWVFPLNTVMAFHLLRRQPPPKWMPPLMLLLSGFLMLLPLVWILNIQAFSPLFILIWLCLGLRFAFLYRHFKSLEFR